MGFISSFGFRVSGLLLLLLAVHPARAQTPAGADPRLGLREAAIQQVLASTRSDDPFLRANAVEASANMPERVTPIVQLALGDPSAVVRFAALATAGRLRLRDLAPVLVQQVTTERTAVQDITRQIIEQGGQWTDEQRLRYRAALADAQSVYAAALFAARRCGADVDISPLAQLLARKDATVRANVAVLLGLMEDPTSAPMLRDMARVPIPKANPVQVALCRLQIAEAMVRLGDESALDAVRAAAYSHLDEVRVMAVTMLGRLGDQRMEKGLAVMLPDPPLELQLAAASSLARLGKEEGLSVALAGGVSGLNPARAQAASTLGLFKDPRAAAMLARLLEDPVEQVRLAAAAGVLEGLRR